MKKYIVSDLHGNGNVYKSIMSYLENKCQTEKLMLYINGDLIDRGPDSAEMLLDIKRRMISNPFEIVYLGGNHELMMFQTYKRRLMGLNTSHDLWFDNGGWVTDYGLEDKLDYNEDKILEVADFVSNLKLYQRFDEKLNGKNIVLVHASCPLKVEDECKERIKDDTASIEGMVWTRENDPLIPFRCRVGDKNYFTIVGHTPLTEKYGYKHFESQDYLNIDGGSSLYVTGDFKCDHVPLVEVYDGFLKILTFNSNNEIVYGNYFVDNVSLEMNEYDLSCERKFLEKSFKPKRLVKLPDNIIGYEDW